jgi:hypothetical protein
LVSEQLFGLILLTEDEISGEWEKKERVMINNFIIASGRRNKLRRKQR